jgi:hypothetical protein
VRCENGFEAIVEVELGSEMRVEVRSRREGKTTRAVRRRVVVGIIMRLGDLGLEFREGEGMVGGSALNCL